MLAGLLDLGNHPLTPSLTKEGKRVHVVVKRFERLYALLRRIDYRRGQSVHGRRLHDPWDRHRA
ncbi:hypothetical protein SBA2_30076 [Acidobacteriia bacterium SbA2]|nr:hypothetical protein SBA2_30076 [Acidobacteriia bacterium SbA2]